MLDKRKDLVPDIKGPESAATLEVSDLGSSPAKNDTLVEHRVTTPYPQSLSKKIDTQIDSNLKLISNYMRASNAQQAQNAIDEIRTSGEAMLANDLEFEIRGRCGFLDGYEPPFERTRWAFELILEYCSNYFPQIAESEKVPLGSGTKILAFTKLRTKLLELETAEFDEYFMEFLASVNSMQELSAAKAIAKDLHHSGAPLSFGITDDRLVTPKETEFVLDTAFELYGCVRFGGCDRHDMRVLEYCVLTGNCERGWNMFDIYSYTLAPNVYEQVINMLNNMVSAGKRDN